MTIHSIRTMLEKVKVDALAFCVEMLKFRHQRPPRVSAVEWFYGCLNVHIDHVWVLLGEKKYDYQRVEIVKPPFTVPGLPEQKQLEEKMGTKFIKAMFEKAEQQKCAEIILVTDNLTSAASKLIKTYTNYLVTVFSYRNTENMKLRQHQWQPQHIQVIPAQDSEAFFQRLPRTQRLETNQLMTRSVSDPLVRYYGARVGDLWYVRSQSVQGCQVEDIFLIVS